MSLSDEGGLMKYEESDSPDLWHRTKAHRAYCRSNSECKPLPVSGPEDSFCCPQSTRLPDEYFPWAAWKVQNGDVDLTVCRKNGRLRSR